MNLKSEFQNSKLQMSSLISCIFRSDYVIWKNFVMGSVYSKIMYLERINIIEKVYANKFQTRIVKKMIGDKKEILHESFKRMNVGFCEWIIFSIAEFHC